MAATHNIVVPEEYESNGETKTKWNNIGVVIESEKNGKTSKRIKLNMIPLGWDGWANVYPIDRDRDNKRHDNRRDASQDEHSQASDDMQQHPPEDVVVEEIDDAPIDLSSIPF